MWQVTTSQYYNNKAGYMATPVACGWAGAVSEVTLLFGQGSVAKDQKKTKKVMCDGEKEGPTDGPMDGQSRVSRD